MHHDRLDSSSLLWEGKLLFSLHLEKKFDMCIWVSGWDREEEKGDASRLRVGSQGEAGTC